MDLSSISEPLNGLKSGRFFLVNYLPTCAASLFILVLIWAGAPVWAHQGDALSFNDAWRTAKGLGAGEIVTLTVAITLIAVLFAPLQLAMMRILEGGRPNSPGAGLACRFQLWRKRGMARDAELPQVPEELTEQVIQRAGASGARLRRRFPLPDHLIRPTALGNALSAMEDTAGRDYGFDPVVAWPRLYPVLGDRIRAVVDDRRDLLDSSGRMTVTAAATAITAFVLLWGSGWWLAFSLIPAAIGAVAYAGTVAAAVAYGEAVRSSFDLHRFDLLKSLRLPLPSTRDEERRLNQALSDMWRQGIPMTGRYDVAN
jgi:hypothetical protein